MLLLQVEVEETTTSEEKPYYTFIVCIITAPDHTEHRRVLRDSSWVGHDWRDNGGNPVTGWKHLFVVGRAASTLTMQKLQAEIAEYGDIVIADEEDSYHNLVLKVMWLMQHMLDNYNFGFVIKTDDDTFININLVNRYLLGLQATAGADKMFFGGVRTGRQPVLRKGRYGVSKDLWEPDIYAPYCSGSGYVLSADTVQGLVNVYKSGVQPLFYVEDAFIGALAFHVGTIDVKNINGFYWHQKYGCTDKDALLMHYVKLDMMADYMKKYKAGKAYC